MPGPYDEAEMTRFLVGDATPDERERIEARFMAEVDYFDAMCALEQELLASLVRGDLPPLERERLEAELSRSPMRLRELDDMRALAAALARSSGQPPSTVASRRRVWIRVAAVAAGIAAVFVVWRQTRLIQRTPVEQVASTPAESVTEPRIATMFLAPGTPRAEAVAQANIFRVPAGVEIVLLTLAVPAEASDNLQARLRIVGGAAVDISGAPVPQQATGRGRDVAVRVPATKLRPGDYVLTLSAGTAGRGTEDIASRFFSVVE